MSNTQTGNLLATDVRKMKIAEKAAVVAEYMAPFFSSGKVVELRLLGVGGHDKRVDAGWFDNVDAFAKAAAPYIGKAHIYFTPNDVLPDLLARSCNKVKEWVKAGQTTSDADIVRRRWFLVDTDPVRPSGISATDVEHEAALVRLARIREYLKRCGWPDPIEQDSGNGGHLEYGVDLPNDDASRDLLSDALQALSAMFSDDKVSVDVTNFNASRIWKVSGAISMKGDDIPTRPHRLAKPINVPESIELVPLEKLQALAKHAPKAEPAQKSDNGRASSTFNLEQWMRDNNIDTGPKLSYKGGSKWKLNKCYFSEDHTDGAYIIQNADGKIAAGCSHNRCDGKTWHDLRAQFDGTAEERKQRWIEAQEAKRQAEQLAKKHKASQPVTQQEKDNRYFAVNPDTGEMYGNEDRANDFLDLDGVLSAIEAIAKDEAITPQQRQARISRDLALHIGRLDRAVLVEVEAAIVSARAGFSATKAGQFVRDCISDAKKQRKQKQTDSSADDERPESWPYIIEFGRMVHLIEGEDEDGNPKDIHQPLADFWARIGGESTDEEGNRYFDIEGCGIRGGIFRFEIAANKYGDGRELQAALEAHAGAYDPIYAGCGPHMVPAIKKLTSGDLVRKRLFHRTGWDKNTFLLPGREPEKTEIRLSRKLPYCVDDKSDLTLGIQALEAIIEFMGAENGAIVASAFFQPPVAKLADWRNERYATFIKGRTGTQKTATASLLMSMYGPDFIRDDMLLKFGEGATRNAIMQYATSAADMPMLIDNFKPSTGGGVHDFTNLIHNILEGGEKERLNRSSQLKETKPIYTWPVCTGEDLPSNDPASLARIMVITFDAKKRGPISQLTKAQSLSKHLNAVGKAWIEWLETPEALQVVTLVSGNLSEAREFWVKKLLKAQPTMANPYRVATNIATNQMTWLILSQHPTLGQMATKFVAAHSAGLDKMAGDMAGYTAKSMEASRFIEALKEQLAGDRLMLLATSRAARPTHQADADRVIGWYGDDGSAYLYPVLSIDLVKRLSSDDLGNVTRNTLYEQLDTLGFIASHDKQQSTKTIKVNGKAQKMLHLTAAALETPEGE